MERERLSTDCSSSTDSADIYTITAQARMWLRAMHASGSEGGKDSWTWELQNGKNLKVKAEEEVHLRWEGQQ